MICSKIKILKIEHSSRNSVSDQCVTGVAVLAITADLVPATNWLTTIEFIPEKSHFYVFTESVEKDSLE